MNARPPSTAALPRRRPSSAPTTPPITAPTTGPTNGTGTTAPRRRAPDIAPATVPAVPPACLARCSKSSSTAHLLPVVQPNRSPENAIAASIGRKQAAFLSVCNYLCRSHSRCLSALSRRATCISLRATRVMSRRRCEASRSSWSDGVDADGGFLARRLGRRAFDNVHVLAPGPGGQRNGPKSDQVGRRCA